MIVVGDISKNSVKCETQYDALKVVFKGEGHSVEVGEGCVFNNFQIFFYGKRSKVIIGQNCSLSGVIHLKGDNCVLTLGDLVKTNAPIFVNLGELGDTLTIGNSCLFANPKFRTSDSHKIYCKNTNERINPSGNIIIEDNVWIAEDVLVMGGVVIQQGSVIGAKSLVNRNIPHNCIAAGVPAKVIKKDIFWKE